MAKSLSSILTQIERLQKEAASIQSGVISRIRKEIATYGLTAEHLFGATAGSATPVASKRKKAAKAATKKAAKYADGAGNTWAGMGKRPDWLRQALDAGKALQDFLVEGAMGVPSKTTKGRKTSAKVKVAPAKRSVAPAKKRASAKKPTPAKKAVAPNARSKRADQEVAAT